MGVANAESGNSAVRQFQADISAAAQFPSPTCTVHYGCPLQVNLMVFTPGVLCYGRETERSAIAEHAWSEHHQIDWEGTAMVDCASRRMELSIKEALHIPITLEQQRLNREVGLELPDCWVATQLRP